MPAYYTTSGERREITDPRFTPSGARKAVQEGYITGGGARKQWFQRGAHYLFGQDDEGDSARAYRVEISGDVLTFAALTNTLAAPSNDAVMQAATSFNGQVLVSWELPSRNPPIRLQAVTLNDDGLAGGAIYPVTGTSTIIVGMFVVGGNLYSMNVSGRIERLSLQELPTPSVTRTFQVTSGDGVFASLGNPGAAAKTQDGTIYLLGNATFSPRPIQAARLSDTFVVTDLTESGANVLGNQHVEAAFGAGADIYVLGRDNESIARGVISGDAITFTLLSSESPESRYYAAATI